MPLFRRLIAVLLVSALLFLVPPVQALSASSSTPGSMPKRWPYQPAAGLESCFAGKDAALIVVHLGSGQRVEFGGERITLPLSPCSTYKIPHALIGLECGVFTGPAQRFSWDGGKRPIKAWERDHSLHSSMSYSVVPVYRWLAAQIGPKRMREWLNRFSYGNRDISSGQTSFWLGESLKISAVEQAVFLKNLVERRFAIASASYAIINQITCQERFDDGEYHGKTGSHLEDGRWTLGWWIGWISHGSDQYVFAGNLRAHEGASGITARRCVEQALKKLGLLSVTREERLALEYQTFDQDMDGGWRAVADSGCELEAARLLEEYLDAHEEKLEGWQRGIIRFHAGQMQAFAGETTAALAHFRKTYVPAEQDRKAPMRWNAYVRATIAFLQNDLKALKACRESMQSGPNDPRWVGPNRAVVDRLIAGFGRQGYREAYCGQPAHP